MQPQPRSSRESAEGVGTDARPQTSSLNFHGRSPPLVARCCGSPGHAEGAEMRDKHQGTFSHQPGMWPTVGCPTCPPTLALPDPAPSSAASFHPPVTASAIFPSRRRWDSSGLCCLRHHESLGVHPPFRARPGLHANSGSHQLLLFIPRGG